MYRIGDLFQVYSAFSNSRDYNYNVGDTLKIVDITPSGYYVLTLADECKDKYFLEYAEVTLDEDEINISLLPLA